MAFYLYIDTEYSTMGKQEIAQFSYILCEDSNLLYWGDHYFRLIGKMNEGAYKVNGLSERRLRGLSSMTFDEFIPTILPIIAKADFIVGHNVSADIGCMMGYNNTSLNNVLESKIERCTMKDYLRILGTEVMGDGGSYLAWTSLQHTVAIMINRYNWTSEELLSTYSTMFNKKPKAHDSLFDTYVVYRLHQFLLGHPDAH